MIQGADPAGRRGGIRAFVGIPLPRRLGVPYAAVQRELRSLGSVKWVEPHNLHLTLKFLGAVDRDALDRVVEALSRAASRASSGATLRARRLAAFPSERAARVLVVELEDPSGAVPKAQREIESELAGLGFPADERPFRLHVTLGRVRQGPVDARAALARVRAPAGEWEVSGFELIESKLGQSGPAYTALRYFGLG